MDSCVYNTDTVYWRSQKLSTELPSNKTYQARGTVMLEQEPAQRSYEIVLFDFELDMHQYYKTTNASLHQGG